MKYLVLCFAVLIMASCTVKQKNKNKSESKSLSVDNNNDKLSAYLMVYFKDETHSLYMAISKDGYTFTALNHSEPVIAGDTIALQRGIRDPHIYRGPKGHFYMALTDLHIYAQRDGLRDTEWERDGTEYGWGNNRALVLMKSDDLINWKVSNFRLDTAYEGMEEIGCAWAPEIIYDEDAQKMMVYFTMRMKSDINKMYYAYADADFTKLVTKPQLLFQYPKDVSYIDGDITKVNGKYHLFYTPHDTEPGIKQAISDSLHSGYQYIDEWVDFEPRACEAPNVWKRLGTDTYVLMYDIYSIQPHNFGFIETKDFKTFKNLGHLNEGVMKATNFSSPKHGAVIHITNDEADRLIKYWHSEDDFK